MKEVDLKLQNLPLMSIQIIQYRVDQLFQKQSYQHFHITLWDALLISE
jgi:hypothetical protein